MCACGFYVCIFNAPQIFLCWSNVLFSLKLYYARLFFHWVISNISHISNLETFAFIFIAVAVFLFCDDQFLHCKHCSHQWACFYCPTFILSLYFPTLKNFAITVAYRHSLLIFILSYFILQYILASDMPLKKSICPIRKISSTTAAMWRASESSLEGGVRLF